MTRILQSWIQATYKQGEQTGKARGSCWWMHGTWISVCSVHIMRVFIRQFLSSAPWWLKFLPFVTVRDIKCHQMKPEAVTGNADKALEDPALFPGASYEGKPSLVLCFSSCIPAAYIALPLLSLIFWWLLAPSQSQIIFSQCLSTESDRKQHLLEA